MKNKYLRIALICIGVILLYAGFATDGGIAYLCLTFGGLLIGTML